MHKTESPIISFTWQNMFIFNIQIIVVLLTISTIVGRIISCALPYRLRPLSKFYLSPCLGLAFFVLIAIFFGWVTGYPKTLFVGYISLAITLVFFYFERQKKALFTHLLIVNGFGILASVAFTSMLLQFDTYNTFNDTFTYLVHSQWLQQHSFSEQVSPSGFHPALTQIALYQHLGLRMGASFFLGWVQALFNEQWSYMVYPAVVTLPLITGSLAVGYCTSLLGFHRRWDGMLIGLFMAVGLGGVTFGAIMGFLPQIYGLAFAVSYLGILGAILNNPRGKSLRSLILSVVPAALMFSVMIYCYSELAPFVTISSLLAGVVLFVRAESNHRKTILILVANFLILVVIFLNRELFRTIPAILAQSNAIVGSPVDWSLSDFLGHAFGFRTGSWDANIWFLFSKTISLILVVVVLSMCMFSIFKIINKKRAKAFLPCGAYVLISLFFFCYFRYFVPSPWAVGVGQSWSQFKVVQWVEPFCFVFIGISLMPIFRRYRVATVSVLVFLISIGIYLQFSLADVRTSAFRSETGYDKSSFEVFLDLRSELQGDNGADNIYLEIEQHHGKLAQLSTYFLYDRDLSGDWSNDGYLYPWLPQDQRNIPSSFSSYSLSFVDSQEAKNTTGASSQFGNLTLEKTPRYKFRLHLVESCYDREVEGSTWRFWTRDILKFQYESCGKKLPEKVTIQFTYLAKIFAPIHIILQSGSSYREIRLHPKSGWNDYSIDHFAVHDKAINITMKTTGLPIPISKTDRRLVTFLIQNLTISPELQ